MAVNNRSSVENTSEEQLANILVCTVVSKWHQTLIGSQMTLAKSFEIQSMYSGMHVDLLSMLSKPADVDNHMELFASLMDFYCHY